MGRTTVKRAPKNPKVIRWDFEGIGYAIHQALRKATDSDWSALMWNMVYVINDDQWGKWVEALMEFMREKFPKGVTIKDEEAVFLAMLEFIRKQKDSIHKNHGYRCLVIGFDMASQQDIRAVTDFCMMACDPAIVGG